ncbi:MAG: sensor domain-containing diguanylate cyclase [Betaproteobacteria bacterium]|nr:sensor domain-containing diguanylate cyclase [Betaproteobacteria bacterium]
MVATAPPDAAAPAAHRINRYGLFDAHDQEQAFVSDEWPELAPRAFAVGLWGGLCFAIGGGVADLLTLGAHAPWLPLLLTRMLVLGIGLRLAWLTRAGASPDPAGLKLWLLALQLATLIGLRTVVQLHAVISPYQVIAAVFTCMVLYGYVPTLRPLQLWVMPAWLLLSLLQMHLLLGAPAAPVALFAMLLGFVNIIGWHLAVHAARSQRTAWLDRRRLHWEIAERITAEQNLRHLFEASPVPLVLAGQPHGQIQHMNQAALDLLDPQRVLSDPALAMAGDFYADAQTRDMLAQALAHHQAFGPVDLRMRNTSQRVVDVMLSARKLRYNGRRTVLVSLVEITHRKRQEHELRRLAHTDPLTALHNRRGFFARSERLRRRPASAPLAMLALDVDHFKRINDTHGHAIGDIVLQQLAGRMASILREDDVLARIGGEEFAALMPATGAQQALRMAERVRRAICEHAVRCQGLRLELSVSIGVALFEEHDDADSVLARADQAMYRAKQSGRNRVQGPESPDAASALALASTPGSTPDSTSAPTSTPA